MISNFRSFVKAVNDDVPNVSNVPNVPMRVTDKSSCPCENAVVRIMNTPSQPTPLGPCVVGLSCGSGFISYEATQKFYDVYGKCNKWVAVTNHHVVGNATTVMCNFHFNPSIPFPATVIMKNVKDDVAFVVFDIPSLIGNRDPSSFLLKSYKGCALGLPVIAAGYPRGTQYLTKSAGTITAYNDGRSGFVYLCTANLMPGNSGGPCLYNERVVGINTAILTEIESVGVVKMVQTAMSNLVYLGIPALPSQDFTHLVTQSYHTRLRSMYNTTLDPQEVCERWRGACDVSFEEWFAKSTPQHVRNVLHLLEHQPESFANVVASGTTNHRVVHELPNTGVNSIVMSSHFNVSKSLMVNPNVRSLYPSIIDSPQVGFAKVSVVQPHETNIRVGDLLTHVNGMRVDMDGTTDGKPFWVSFTSSPETKVRMTFARPGEAIPVEVDYVHTRQDVSCLPRVVQAGYSCQPCMRLPSGHVTVRQLCTQTASKYGHTEYLHKEMSDSFVLVAPFVHAMSEEWLISRIAPGSLLTEINGQKLTSYGNNLTELMASINNILSQPGLQSIVCSFKCATQHGTTKTVSQVYSVCNPENSVHDVDHVVAHVQAPCQCELCEAN